jgi:hypothetical protein
MAWFPRHGISTHHHHVRTGTLFRSRRAVSPFDTSLSRNRPSIVRSRKARAVRGASGSSPCCAASFRLRRLRVVADLVHNGGVCCVRDLSPAAPLRQRLPSSSCPCAGDRRRSRRQSSRPSGARLSPRRCRRSALGNSNAARSPAQRARQPGARRRRPPRVPTVSLGVIAAACHRSADPVVDS